MDAATKKKLNLVLAFVKRNCLFLGFSLLILVLLVILLSICLTTSEQFDKEKKKVEELQRKIKTIGNARLKLVPENIELAQKNSVMVAEKALEMRKTIAGAYTLKVDVNEKALTNPMEGLQTLRHQLNELADYAERNELEIPGDGGFTFLAYKQTSKMLAAEELPKIFKSLALVRSVLEIAVKSGVRRIDGFDRLMDLDLKKEAFYTVTPFRIKIVATPKIAQTFINDMANQKQLFFALRTVSVKAADGMTAVGGGLGLEGSTAASQERRAPADMEEGPRGRRGRKPENGMDEPSGQNAGSKTGEEGDLVAIPPTRQDFLIYRNSKVSTWDLRYDLIEFLPVEEEKK